MRPKHAYVRSRDAGRVVGGRQFVRSALGARCVSSRLSRSRRMIQPENMMECEMKVRAVLEFDLEDVNAAITNRREFVRAAEAAHDAIRARLMGDGFLADDTLFGTYNLEVDVVDGEIGAATEA